MARFAILTTEGEIPREYVARELYACRSFGPNNAKLCVRTVRNAHKDFIGYRDTVKVKANKKSGRPEADDENGNRSRDELRCESLLSTTGALGKIAVEMKTSDANSAMIHVPELVKGMKKIRITQAKIVGDDREDRMDSDKTRTAILGKTHPSWLLDMCQDYVLASFSKAFESGNFSIAFSKLSMTPSLNENAKLCLSVLNDDKVKTMRSKQTESIVKTSGGQISPLSSSAANALNDGKKQADKSVFKKTKRAEPFAMAEDTVRSSNAPSTLCDVPQFLQSFSEVACASIKTDI